MKRGKVAAMRAPALLASLGAASLFLVSCCVLAGCHKDADKNTKAAYNIKAPPPPLKALQIHDDQVGTGPAAEPGDYIAVSYKGTLANDEAFDETKGGPPLCLQLGENQVIKGWDEGLVGMKEGGRRHISVPYALGYGDAGKPPIPPKCDLFFDCYLTKLIKLRDAQKPEIREDIPGKTGKAAAVGDRVAINYSLMLLNGQEMDSSDAQGHSEEFTVGDKKVLKGIELGVVGMKAGGSRLLILSPEIAFGSGFKGIPPYQIMKVKITLMSVNKPA